KAVLEQIGHVRVVLDDEHAQRARHQLRIPLPDTSHQLSHPLGHIRRVEIELHADAALLGRLGLADPTDHSPQRDDLEKPRKGEPPPSRGPPGAPPARKKEGPPGAYCWWCSGTKAPSPPLFRPPGWPPPGRGPAVPGSFAARPPGLSSPCAAGRSSAGKRT